MLPAISQETPPEIPSPVSGHELEDKILSTADTVTPEPTLKPQVGMAPVQCDTEIVLVRFASP